MLLVKVCADPPLSAGWGGPACTWPMRQKQWPPLWLTYTFMLVSILLSGIAWLVARHILNDFLERRRIAAEENQALLVRLHHSSTDTSVQRLFS